MCVCVCAFVCVVRVILEDLLQLEAKYDLVSRLTKKVRL